MTPVHVTITGTPVLSPCPFCGSKGGPTPVWGGLHYVSCFECYACGPHKPTVEQAIAGWEERAAALGSDYQRGIADSVRVLAALAENHPHARDLYNHAIYNVQASIGTEPQAAQDAAKAER